MGRPPKISEKVQDKVCTSLRAGNTRLASALHAGISKSTFHNYIERGTAAKKKKEEEKKKLTKLEQSYLDFLDAVTRAEADCEVWHVANMKKHAIKDWRASLEWLKRRRPEQWSEKINATFTNIDYSKLTDEQLDRLADGEPIERVLAQPPG